MTKKNPDYTGPPRRLVVGVNDLLTVRPDIALEWHPTLNTTTPSGVSSSTSKKAWWIASCGHTWESAIAGRTRMGSGCPYCAGKRPITGINDLATTHPHLATQWADTNELPPTEYLPRSCKKVDWVCGAGHRWSATPSNRTAKNPTGCPLCVSKQNPKIEQSIGEALLLQFGERPEFHYNTGIDLGHHNKAVVDLYVSGKNLCVEHDGRMFHAPEERILSDIRKTKKLLDAGYSVIRLREKGLESLNIQHPRYSETNIYWTLDEPRLRSWISDAYLRLQVTGQPVYSEEV